jgi:hypothetical protein
MAGFFLEVVGIEPSSVSPLSHSKKALPSQVITNLFIFENPLDADGPVSSISLQSSPSYAPVLFGLIFDGSNVNNKILDTPFALLLESAVLEWAVPMLEFK